MIRALRRWFGLKCWLHLCGAKVGHTCDGGVCWCCATCGREIE